MAMDMARIDESTAVEVNSLSLVHCVLDGLPDSPCLKSSPTSFEEAVAEGRSVFGDEEDIINNSNDQDNSSSCGAVVTTHEDFAECLNFVTEAECGDVGVRCFEDFDKLPDCGDEGETSKAEEEGCVRIGGGGEQGELLESVSLDCSRNSENLELRDLGELWEGSERPDSVPGNEVGEEEALLLAEAAKATGDVVSASDSGECSSVDRKDNQASPKSSKNAAPGKKKAKVDWTPELHRRFVHAVEQLGVEKAYPSRILELMGVQCLTRHNIASHLQKYRSHRRHLAAREAEAASWTHRRTYTQAPWPRSSRRDGLPYLVPIHTPHIQPRPSMAMAMQPQLQTPHHPISTPLKVWGYPTVDHSNVHMWQQPAVATPSYWQAADGSYWQHPATGYDAFSARACYSHPMQRVPVTTTHAGLPIVAPGFPDESCYYGDDMLAGSMYLCNQSYDSEIGRAAGVAACSKPIETHLSKEVLDAAIGEALANPWTPPPLGLKPPSMEGVIAELQRQGINTVPPSTC
ncbi:transcription activator GLK1 [Physcomitrium patens]|uniref:Golden 2-like protein 2 n=1 Tax=Physcomitrium patens TaxID=3218 RepID=Q5IFL6_PHYPA|nr:transcription activator GLK1-like [Physcomitrium patens]AAV54521.1 golden 2-like protein 2 [Physcomitrium patens]PNR45549.1 hypothetical protein PHYPA_015320 [Physcomitrium patens]|eukprot:XP_024388769.1 transcription activator GLK1-like [Physcomitrella patens]